MACLALVKFDNCMIASRNGSKWVCQYLNVDVIFAYAYRNTISEATNNEIIYIVDSIKLNLT